MCGGTLTDTSHTINNRKLIYVGMNFDSPPSLWSLGWLACVPTFLVVSWLAWADLAKLALWSSYSLFPFVWWTCAIFMNLLLHVMWERKDLLGQTISGACSLSQRGNPGGSRYLLRCYWLEAAIQGSEADATSKTHGQRQTSSMKATPLEKKKSSQNTTTSIQYFVPGTKYSNIWDCKGFPTSIPQHHLYILYTRLSLWSI